jgi:hypothetical protein
MCGDRARRRLRVVFLGRRHVPLGKRYLALGDIRAPRARRRRRWRWLQRSVRTSRGGISRHGQQRVHVRFHPVDVGG